MIKVYVFVTGLALYQFASLTAGGTSYVILAAGDYDYPKGAHIDPHELTIQAGNDPVPTPFPSKLEAAFTVKCPEGGCTAVKEPAAIPSLVTLLRADRLTPTLVSKCTEFTGAGPNSPPPCHPRDVPGHDGRNGLLAFKGKWQVDALTDCGDTYPSDKHPTIEMNFIRAGRPWLASPESFPAVRNSVLFSTVVNDMSELQITNAALQKMFDPAQIKIADCKKLFQFQSSGAAQCVAVTIRNGTPPGYYMGGGDLHYAALSALLSNQIDFADVWLPITLMSMSACPGGAGAGLSHCTGGVLLGN